MSSLSRSPQTASLPRHSHLAPFAKPVSRICLPYAVCACVRPRVHRRANPANSRFWASTACASAFCVSLTPVGAEHTPGCSLLSAVGAQAARAELSANPCPRRDSLAASRTPSRPAALPRDACARHALLNENG